MNVAAGPELAAAVTNAGGLGVIGGVGYTPNILRQQVRSASLLLTVISGA
jgi:NAD(P)H-dependent flavin oxidoreductase YrpB (nitropropane dioxygenase family)